MEKCPFCGKQQEGDYKGQFVCGTYWARFAKEYIQSPLCMKFELTALKERLEDVYLKDRGKTQEINILTKENTALSTRLAVAEKAIQNEAYGEDTVRVRREDLKFLFQVFEAEGYNIHGPAPTRLKAALEGKLGGGG